MNGTPEPGTPILTLPTSELFSSRLSENTQRMSDDMERCEAYQAELQHLQGVAALKQGEVARAIPMLRSAVEASPGIGTFHDSLGTGLCEAGEWNEAIRCFRRALDLDQTSHHTLFKLGRAQVATGRYKQAVQTLQTYIQEERGDARAHDELGAAFYSLGRTTTAARCFTRAIELAPDAAGSRVNLATAMLGTDIDGAEKQLRTALTLDPYNLEALAALATVLSRKGDLQQARSYLKPHLEEAGEHLNLALSWANICLRSGTPYEAIDLIQGHIKTATKPHELVALRHTLGQLLEAIGETDLAFQQHRTANELKGVRFDVEAVRSEVAANIETFGARSFWNLNTGSEVSEEPVFVVGMARSGTSVVERILARHADIHGAGEVGYIDHIARNLPKLANTDRSFPSCAQDASVETIDTLAALYMDKLRKNAGGASRIIDSTPLNFFQLGLIAQLFPKARIIHCVRNPLDTLLSCYFDNLSHAHAYANSLDNLGEFYKSYRAMTEHWDECLPLPMLKVSYDDLVADATGTTEKVLAFLGVPYEERCIRGSTEVVTEAASTLGLNRYRERSRRRADAFDNQLAPLRKLLAG